MTMFNRQDLMAFLGDEIRSLDTQIADTKSRLEKLKALYGMGMCLTEYLSANAKLDELEERRQVFMDASSKLRVGA